MNGSSHFKIDSSERNNCVNNPCNLFGRKRYQRGVERKNILWPERSSTMEDRAARKVFADDMTITFKYWETVIRQNYSYPEKELMFAVLKDAIMTYKKRIYSGNALFKEAESWLFERECDRLFSFETICAVLGLSPGKIRSELLTWKLNTVSDLSCETRQSRSDAKPAMKRVNFG
jgi:hypothetical protein